MPAPSSLIPRSDISSAALFFVVAALCFFNAFASLGIGLVWSATSDWTDRAVGELTIRIRGGEKPTQRAAEIVRSDPGIGEARILARAETEALLTPWLGTIGLPEDLPLPGLVAVKIRPGIISGSSETITRRLEKRLEQARIDFRLDNHADFIAQIKRITTTIRAVLLLIWALLWMTALAVISFATRAALAARRDIVEVLHLSGAKDTYIAALFERHFFAMGLQAGIIGAICALTMVSLIGHGIENSEKYAWLLPQTSLSFRDFPILLYVPAIAALASMGAARATAMRTLAALA